MLTYRFKTIARVNFMLNFEKFCMFRFYFKICFNSFLNPVLF